MKKRRGIATAILCACLLPVGCSSPQSSSGFHLEGRGKELPPGIPERVGVALFAGEEPINRQATELFSAGLLEIGFDVIERSSFQSIIDELNISSSDLFSESTRAALGQQSGLKAIFAGSVTGEDSTTWVDTHVNVKLVDVETGRVLWTAAANDPWKPGRRLRSDVRTSVMHSVNKALELLKEDLEKLEEDD